MSFRPGGCDQSRLRPLHCSGGLLLGYLSVGSNVSEGGERVPGLFDPPLQNRPWPLGHHYSAITSPGGRPEAQWVAFKLAAAGWYLETLGCLFAETKDLDRFVGVEMALDGFLTAVSSAFDAAV